MPRLKQDLQCIHYVERMGPHTHTQCEVCWKKNRRSKVGQTGAINADLDLCGQISAIFNKNSPSSPVGKFVDNQQGIPKKSKEKSNQLGGSYPIRNPPPNRQKKLSLTCTPENNTLTRDLLLHHYGSSTSNTCPHQQLPCMEGPPVEIHIKAAVPVAHHKSIPVPIHWRDKVNADLARDVALDAIEPVPLRQAIRLVSSHGRCKRT